MSAMTQAQSADPLTDDRADRPLDVWISVALVTGLVVVHLLMALSYSTLPDAVFDAINGFTGPALGTLVVSVLPALPLAAVVLLWAQSRFLGGLACAVVLTEALLGHLRGVVLRRLIDAGHPSTTFFDVSGWVLAAILPAAVVLAWGLARRRGRSWLPGVAVAAGTGLSMRAIDFSDPAVTDPGLHALVLATTYHVVPALVGGLVAWRLQARSERP
jgi:hypothetical protein